MNDNLGYMGREAEMFCGKESFQFLLEGSGVAGGVNVDRKTMRSLNTKFQRSHSKASAVLHAVSLSHECITQTYNCQLLRTVTQLRGSIRARLQSGGLNFKLLQSSLNFSYVNLSVLTPVLHLCSRNSPRTKHNLLHCRK